MITNNLITQNKALIESWDRLQFNRNRDWDLYGYDIGIHPVNMAIGGIIPTKVTVVGARSGSGKTGFVAQMFEASLRRKSDASRVEFLFFTWELDPSIVIDRGVCLRTGLTIRQLNQGAKLLGEKTMANVKSAYEVISKYPIVYQPYSLNINEVVRLSTAFIERCKEKSKVEGNHIHPVLVIDYLNMAQFDNEGLRTYGIASFMNGLKQFCNNTKASAIILAQLSRETDKQSKLPDRADFSDSGAIENAADNLIALYRPEHHGLSSIMNPDTGVEVDSRNKMLIRVLKGRDYGTGDFLINCDIKFFRFWDLNQQWDTLYYEDYKNPDFWKNEFGLLKKEIKQTEELPF